MTRTYRKWTQEEYVLFVQRWQAAASVAEVAEAFDLAPQTIANTAANLRKKGVPLKKMTANRKPRIDYQALTSLALELQE